MKRRQGRKDQVPEPLTLSVPLGPTNRTSRRQGRTSEKEILGKEDEEVTFKNASVFSRHLLFGPTRRVSMEHHSPSHPDYAEFHCSITSPFFALPILMLPSLSLSALFSCMIALFSVYTATASFMYHKTVCVLWSVLDCIGAVWLCMALTQHLVTSYLLTHGMITPALVYDYQVHSMNLTRRDGM